MVASQNVHAAGLLIDGTGLLVRGPSGAGKSLLLLDLLDWAASRGKDAFLVADDRLEILARDGTLFMQAPPTIAGMVELRGRGIVSRPHIAIAPVDLVVDLVDKMERLVEEDQLVTEISEIEVARCPVPQRKLVDPIHQRLLVIEALREHAAA